MKKVLFSICFFITLNQTNAQERSVLVSGYLVDASDGEAIIGANVLFINVKDSTRSRFTTTNENGNFKLDQLERAFYKIQMSSMGYKTYQRIIRVGEIDLELGRIMLEPDVEILKEVDIKGDIAAVEHKGDTIQYNAAAFKVNPDASTKDLVSKMPGIEVTSSGVTANGESIEQVLLDGKRFFGQDPLLSLNTIPAEVVNKVEVFDQRSEQAQFTGYDDGNTTKTMNVVTKEDRRNGQFGKVYSGYGTENLYKAGGNINSFNKDQRLTLLGMSNNINQQNFSNEDLAGVSGGQRRGFRGGGNNTLMTANQDGINSTNSVGLNFTDDWGSSATFEGSYFYNMTNNSNNQLTLRESFVKSGSQLYEEDQKSSTDNQNHRLNMRITYDINDNNKLIVLPRISFQDNNSIDNTQGFTTSSTGVILNQTDNIYSSENFAYNINNNIILQHKLGKVGRSISLDINTQVNNVDRENIYSDYAIDSLTEYITDQNKYTLGSTFIYTEPIGLSAQLSASYGLSYEEQTSNKDTYLVEKESDFRTISEPLSNRFSSGQIMHRPEINFMNRKFGQFFNVGIAYQQTILNNNQIYPEENNFKNSFCSFLPMLMGRLELNGGADMMFRYSTTTTIPSVSQLQNVVDNSNPFFWSIGNPGLEQSYAHSLVLRIGKSNSGFSRSISNFTRAQYTENYISDRVTMIDNDSTSIDGLSINRGTQLSQPINLDGYWNIQNNTTYSFEISPLKSKLNTSLGLTYTRKPGLTNDIINYSNSYGSNGRINLVSNINENIDFNLFYTAGFNKVVNTIEKNSNSSYLSQTIGGNLNLILNKGFVFRSDLTYQDYKGVSDAFNTYYTLWNLGVAKKFLKNNAAELELSVYDVLRQNQSISQTIEATYLEETKTEVLQQYFMLTFVYNIRRFKGK